MDIISTKDLCYSYNGENNAVDHLSVRFQRGRVSAVLGGNGAGKSTLFLMLNGILKPKSGTVWVDGKQIIYKKSEMKRLRSQVGIVFQNPDDQLFSSSVYQDIAYGAMNMGLPEDVVKKRTAEAMELMGIAELAQKPVHALSFGQKKRVAVAGVLVMEPKVMILDEPTAGVDPVGVSELMHVLLEVCRQRGTTVILSTHDIDVVPVYADEVFAIEKGRLVASGTPEEVFADPSLLRRHHLRLPRIAHLMEILAKEDQLPVSASAATIGLARREILNMIKGSAL